MMCLPTLPLVCPDPSDPRGPGSKLAISWGWVRESHTLTLPTHRYSHTHPSTHTARIQSRAHPNTHTSQRGQRWPSLAQPGTAGDQPGKPPSQTRPQRPSSSAPGVLQGAWADPPRHSPWTRPGNSPSGLAWGSSLVAPCPGDTWGLTWTGDKRRPVPGAQRRVGANTLDAEAQRGWTPIGQKQAPSTTVGRQGPGPGGWGRQVEALGETGTHAPNKKRRLCRWPG